MNSLKTEQKNELVSVSFLCLTAIKKLNSLFIELSTVRDKVLSNNIINEEKLFDDHKAERIFFNCSAWMASDNDYNLYKKLCLAEYAKINTLDNLVNTFNLLLQHTEALRAALRRTDPSSKMAITAIYKPSKLSKNEAQKLYHVLAIIKKFSKVTDIIDYSFNMF